MAKSDRKKAKELAAKGVSAKRIEQRTGVSSTAAEKFVAKAAPPMTISSFTPQPSQAVSGTPYDSLTGAYQTYQTQLPGGQSAYSQNEIGAAGQQYLADFIAGKTTGSFAEWEAAGGYQGGGLEPAPASAPAATGGGGGGGGKQKQKKDKTQNPLREALKGVGKSLSGSEALKIVNELGVKQDRLLNTAQKMGIAFQGSLERRVQKGDLATPEEKLLAMVFDNKLPDRNGGMTGAGIPASLDPRSTLQKTLASGTVGLDRGQRLTGVTKTGQPIITTKDQINARRQAIAAAPNVTQPATDMTAGADMTEPAAAAGGDFGLGDLGVDMGPSASDQALLDAISGLTNAFSDQFGSQAADPYGDLFGDIFGGMSATDPITAEILRKYGVGRNYNIDAIRAALRRPSGRSAYLRSSMGDGTNPLRSALSFAPQLTIA